MNHIIIVKNTISAIHRLIPQLRYQLRQARYYYSHTVHLPYHEVDPVPVNTNRPELRIFSGVPLSHDTSK